MSQALLLEKKRSFRSLFDRVEALFREAEKALSKEDFERACYFFQAAHNKDPENEILYLKEAKLWHKYSLIYPKLEVFSYSYKAYKTSFSSSICLKNALMGAFGLKIEEARALGSKNALQTCEHLLKKIEIHSELFLQSELTPLKADLIFEKAKSYQDLYELHKAISFFKALTSEKKDPFYLKQLASCHIECFKLSRKIEHLLKSIQFLEEALLCDSLILDLYSKLAESYQHLYSVIKEEGCIEKFNDTLELASLLDQDRYNLDLFHSEGLIRMGIDADNQTYVKLGLDKLNLLLLQDKRSIHPDLLIAQALCYLGNKKESHSLIEEAFLKIKGLEDDLSNPTLTLTMFEILMAYGRYFLELDYFYQAIERIQEAMSETKSSRLYFSLLAKAYLEVSYIDNNPQSCEHAVYFIDKALKYYECPRLLLQKAMILSRLGELKQQNEIFNLSLDFFEAGFSMMKLLYQPSSKELFEYAKTLDFAGNFHEDEEYYIKALETLSHLLMVDPGYKDLHHQIALTQFHYGELSGNPEIIKKSLTHFKLALVNPDNDTLTTDWAIACMTLSEMAETSHEVIFYQHEAASKLKKALKNGSLQAYYFLACLYSLNEMIETAISFLKLAEKHECLPSAEDLMQDEWLSNLRNETEFLKLVDRQEMRRT